MQASGASEALKMFAFSHQKMLFLSICCWYVRNFVSTNTSRPTCLQNSESKNKVHYWGGGGGISSPPATLEDSKCDGDRDLNNVLPCVLEKGRGAERVPLNLSLVITHDLCEQIFFVFLDASQFMTIIILQVMVKLFIFQWMQEMLMVEERN